jgi:Tol biopolymer transport system component
MKVRTTGQAAPELLKGDLNPFAGNTPTWSPDGQWIQYSDQGEHLISQDGKTSRKLEAAPAWAYAFSADSKQLYGLRSNGPNRELFSIGLNGGPERKIGTFAQEFAPGINLSPAQRMSLSPDGKTLVYPSRRTTLNLWLMEGLPAQ